MKNLLASVFIPRLSTNINIHMISKALGKFLKQNSIRYIFLRTNHNFASEHSLEYHQVSGDKDFEYNSQNVHCRFAMLPKNGSAMDVLEEVF